MRECWLPIPSFPGYEASDQGNIRSVNRIVICKDGRRRRYKGVVLKPGITNGYRYVVLRRKSIRVANLVLVTHVGPKPFPRALGRHLDDNGLDDRLSNLAWGSHADNWRDAVRNGTAALGSRNGRARLSESDVLQIRAAVAKGLPRRGIAETYGIAIWTVHDIMSRRRWGHI